jgi:hypothetical protein
VIRSSGIGCTDIAGLHTLTATAARKRPRMTSKGGLDLQEANQSWNLPQNRTSSRMFPVADCAT